MTKRKDISEVLNKRVGLYLSDNGQTVEVRLWRGNQTRGAVIAVVPVSDFYDEDGNYFEGV